jgi:hypothetical protein
MRNCHFSDAVASLDMVVALARASATGADLAASQTIVARPLRAPAVGRAAAAISEFGGCAGDRSTYGYA